MESSNNNRLACQYGCANYVAPTESALRKHNFDWHREENAQATASRIQEEAKTANFNCPYCNHGFASTSGVNKHIRNMRKKGDADHNHRAGIVDPLDPQDALKTCPRCGCSFGQNKSNLNRHIKTCRSQFAVLSGFNVPVPQSPQQVLPTNNHSPQLNIDVPFIEEGDVINPLRGPDRRPKANPQQQDLAFRPASSAADVPPSGSGVDLQSKNHHQSGSHMIDSVASSLPDGEVHPMVNQPLIGSNQISNTFNNDQQSSHTQFTEDYFQSIFRTPSHLQPPSPTHSQAPLTSPTFNTMLLQSYRELTNSVTSSKSQDARTAHLLTEIYESDKDDDLGGPTVSREEFERIQNSENLSDKIVLRETVQRKPLSHRKRKGVKILRDGKILKKVVQPQKTESMAETPQQQQHPVEEEKNEEAACVYSSSLIQQSPLPQLQQSIAEVSSLIDIVEDNVAMEVVASLVDFGGEKEEHQNQLPFAALANPETQQQEVQEHQTHIPLHLVSVRVQEEFRQRNIRLRNIEGVAPIQTLPLRANIEEEKETYAERQIRERKAYQNQVEQEQQQQAFNTAREYGYTQGEALCPICKNMLDIRYLKDHMAMHEHDKRKQREKERQRELEDKQAAAYQEMLDVQRQKQSYEADVFEIECDICGKVMKSTLYQRHQDDHIKFGPTANPYVSSTSFLEALSQNQGLQHQASMSSLDQLACIRQRQQDAVDVNPPPQTWHERNAFSYQSVANSARSVDFPKFHQPGISYQHKLGKDPIPSQRAQQQQKEEEEYFKGRRGFSLQNTLNKAYRFPKMVSKLQHGYNGKAKTTPLDKEDLKHLPIAIIDQNDMCTYKDSACYICMIPYEVGHQVLVARCGHYGHLDCFRKWLNISMECPFCKQLQTKTNIMDFPSEERKSFQESSAEAKRLAAEAKLSEKEAIQRAVVEAQRREEAREEERRRAAEENDRPYQARFDELQQLADRTRLGNLTSVRRQRQPRSTKEKQVKKREQKRDRK